MYLTRIPQVLVLLLVVSAFATAFAISPADSVDAFAVGPGTSPSVVSTGGPEGGAAGSQSTDTLLPTPGGQSPAAGEPSGKSVLIYGLGGGEFLPAPWDYNEASIAADLGHAVDVVDAQTWFGMTADQFAAYDAIIFGDPKCEGVGDLGTVLLEPANVNKAVWSPAITGPTIVVGTTPQFYQFNPNTEDRELIANGIEFATSGPGTGLYVSLSCYFMMAPSDTPVEFLSEVGDFQVGGREGCTDPNTVVDPTHPAMLGLTSLGQPDWGCASQELLTTFPASLVPLATAIRASDGAELPFIVASPYEAPGDPPVDPPVDPPEEAPEDPPFAEMWAEIEVEDDEVEVEGGFRLGTDSDGIDPENEDVTVGIGPYTFTIPAGSFDVDDDEEWEFEGEIDGVEVEMEIEWVGDDTFEFEIEVEGADFDDLENPVEISLTIWDDSGTTTATAEWEDEDDDEEEEDGDGDDDEDEDEDDDEDD